MNCLILSVILSFSLNRFVYTLHPDAGLSLYDLAAKHGYPIEIHEVVTEDDYILIIHRIPTGTRCPVVEKDRPPILLVHGMFGCPENFMSPGPDKALAYLLVDAGHDVWMVNSRGNFYSRRHKTLNPDKDKKAYWSFSWDEIGRYDLPVTIDYILNETSTTQLQLVGYSQGGSAYAVMGAERPEYNAKIKLATLIAPAIEMSHVKNKIAVRIAPYWSYMYRLAKFFGMREFMPRSRTNYYVAKYLLDEGKPLTWLYLLFLALFSGDDREQLDARMFPVFLTAVPAGMNFKQAIHYMQLMHSKRFQRFDYGKKNWKIYGAKEPPLYDVTKITSPVAFFTGKNDLLTSEEDIQNVAKKLPNTVGVFSVKHDKWTHLDVIFARDVREFLFNDVIKVIESYK